MNKLKFETNSFGIKRCIINTNSKWCDYSIYESFDNLPDTNSTKVLRVDTTRQSAMCCLMFCVWLADRYRKALI